MKKLAGKRIFQVFLVCLTAICMLISLGSLFLSLLTTEIGLYAAETQDDYQEILKEEQKNLEQVYAYAILSEGKKSYDLMENSNLKYMVVQAEGNEISEQLVYSSKNLTENSDEFRRNANYMEIIGSQADICDSSYFVSHVRCNYKNICSALLQSRELRPEYWIGDHDNIISGTIRGICYYETTGRFYYRSFYNKKAYLFPIRQISLSEEESYEWDGYHYTSISAAGKILQTKDLATNQANSDLWFDNFYYSTADVDILDESAFQDYLVQTNYLIPYEQEYKKEDYASPIDFSLYYSKDTTDEKIIRYRVYTDLNTEIQKNEPDYFYEQQLLYQKLFQYRYHFIWYFILSTILGLATIALSLYGVMQQKQAPESLIRKVPLLILLGVFVPVSVLNIWALAVCANSCLTVPNGMLPLPVSGTILCLIAELILCMLLLEECTARIRDKVFLKNTVCYHLLHFCKKYLKIAWRCVRKGLGMIPMYPKVILGFLAVSILELIVIGATEWDVGTEIFLFFCFKLIETPLLFLVTLHIHRLQNAAKQMAEGDLEHHVNTRHMFSICKKHGNYLNQIAEGMNLAIEERLKSERFRTELITNVSHDIKTPLTSIVNYVDLLQKEGISNEEREEYIEVLDRQSARLKKLIDDLMDASKASTGNVELHLEKCDVGIMMVQTLGEYEEKMAALDLQLIPQEASGRLLVQADSRHLWRVFDNLLNNICKYSQPGTRVYINQETDEKLVKIIFRNTSKYPLNLNSEELLERFTRGDSSRHTEGSGLGLSIAKNLTELMHGQFILTTDGDLFKVIIALPKFS